MTHRYLAIASSAILMLGSIVSPTLHAAERSPAETVQAFNQALSKHDMDAALALIANGSVQFTLRSAHSDIPSGGPASVTGDLKAHWSAIGPVVFGSTTAYNRTPKITNARVDGDLATVWTDTATETVGKNGSKRSDSFSEVYLLVHTASGWQIGAVADNRGANKISAGAPAASGGK
jgi:hypothetical protein